MSGWHTKSSLGRRRSKLLSTIIWLNRWYITHTMGSWYSVQGGRGGQFLTLMKITLMTRTYCLAGSMVLPVVELFYMSPPLIIGGRRGMVNRLNTCFKASERSSGRRRRMCVWSVQTQMRSKMKCGSATLRQTVPVFHSTCIAHIPFSDKYIIIKSCFFNAINAALLLIQVWCFLCSLQFVFYMQNAFKMHINWG